MFLSRPRCMPPVLQNQFCRLEGLVFPTMISGSSAELLELLGRRKRRRDNILIAGAAAKIACNADSHFLFRRIGIVAQKFDESRENAGGTKPALETVMLVKGLLQRMQLI